MSRDPELSAALRALRESMDGQRATAERTQIAILARARVLARNRRRAVFTVTAFAVVLVAAAAWAAVSSRFNHEPGEPTHHGAHSLSPGGRAPPPPTQPAATGSSESSGAQPQSPSPDITVLKPSAAPSAALGDSRVNGARKSPATTSSASVSPREQALYDLAHTAHFVDHDPAAALRGWDAYLAAYPSGRFTPEAAYNRAVSLVRLGHRAEARAALAPFARGDYAGYREHQARELLGALSADAGGADAP
jgi:TolA-binding protein